MATLELTPMQKLDVISLRGLLLFEGDSYRYSPEVYCLDCHTCSRCDGRMGIVQAKETIGMDKLGSKYSYKDAGTRQKQV